MWAPHHILGGCPTCIASPAQRPAVKGSEQASQQNGADSWEHCTLGVDQKLRMSHCTPAPVYTTFDSHPGWGTWHVQAVCLTRFKCQACIEMIYIRIYKEKNKVAQILT